jgi:hypothetical protein
MVCLLLCIKLHDIHILPNVQKQCQGIWEKVSAILPKKHHSNTIKTTRDYKYAKTAKAEGLRPSADKDWSWICLRTFLSKTSKQYEFKDLDVSKDY